MIEVNRRGRPPKLPARNTEPIELRAVLPPAIGVNHLYRVGRSGCGQTTRVYKAAAAVSWEQASMLVLRQAGFHPLPSGNYRIAVTVATHTRRQDIDAPLKALLDLLCAALGIDDRAVDSLVVRKVQVATRADERLEVHVTVSPQAPNPPPDAPGITTYRIQGQPPAA